ncbi:hypothetical protein RD792_015979 [Penstemon davidsonii]|uniref:FAD/NAD(P)-binding oxidoreductase family protein n=1 Tax=Penstemon davidsonii TaxID=160366 RepID=A0ABR0CJ46_9LAMI|nr:hypothetical protein RD792_015979 [Penstemon davidsonii]
MKGPLDRTKVVLRHLPPTISQSNLVEHVDSRFAGRYRWLSFRPGKSRLRFQTSSPYPYAIFAICVTEAIHLQDFSFGSCVICLKFLDMPNGLKHLIYSRAYIDFIQPEDVIEFADFFNGHVFVNEKGTQFKTIVEYAPSQRVPKQWSKKDGREGTILKDPEYLEFLHFLAKPVENLPSAEIQLERKEAERAGAPKDAPIVTPLMEYVRQKRAAKGGARRIVMNGKSTRRAGGMSSRNPVSGKRTSTTMYVLRENSKGVISKDKSTYLLCQKQDDQNLEDNSVNLSALSRSDSAEGGSGGSGYTEMGKKKILLLKGKEKEICNVSGGPSLQQNAATPAKSSHISPPFKQNQQKREASGRIIRSILLNRDNRQNQPTSGSQSELRIQPSNQDRDKRPPRPPSVQSFPKDSNGAPEDKVVNNDLHAIHTEKQERPKRNKDRPDRGVWTPLRRSDGSHGSNDSLSSSTSQTSQVVDSAEEIHVDMKNDMLMTRGGEYRPIGSGRGSRYSDNGSYRHGGRRGSVYSIKDADGSSVLEGKPSKRGGSYENDICAGKPEADVIVIGSGIGGLCCGALLARYNQDVLVLESHDLPGGAAHSFEIKGYKFDSGPSLFSGFQSRGPQANPLAQVLDALGESLPCAKYDSWMVYVPEGEFLSRIGPTEFFKDLQTYAGPDAVQEWRKLLDAILPLSAAAMALPPLSIRGDLGVLSTAGARYALPLLKSFAQMGPQGALSATKLLRPFSEIVDSLELKDPFIRNWVDLLAFLLAGVKSDGVLSAEMIYMFSEWYKPGCCLEYPIHGSGALVDALVRGLTKFNGRLSLKSHVENIIVEDGRAIGVKLRGGQFVRAKKAVVSNASMWDTLNLLPKELVPKSYQERIKTTPQCESFMHLHLGFDAKDIREDLGIHHIVVNDWERGVDADQNVVLISVPSVLSPDLAPPGKHVLHAYTPGTEPFELWEGLDRRSNEYKELKNRRSEVMWKGVERALGSGFSRDKCEVKLVGTPLTHQRFLRRNRGTYGPAIKAGENTFPGHSTPIAQLLCCGDSTFPGIGVPAVAASGAIVANSLVSVSQHSELLDAVGI